MVGLSNSKLLSDCSIRKLNTLDIDEHLIENVKKEHKGKLLCPQKCWMRVAAKFRHSGTVKNAHHYIL